MVTSPGRAQLLIGAEPAHQEATGFPADFAVHQAGQVFA
jgi:uncharacterized protein (UPF0305 family)